MEGILSLSKAKVIIYEDEPKYINNYIEGGKALITSFRLFLIFNQKPRYFPYVNWLQLTTSKQRYQPSLSNNDAFISY